MIFAQKSFPKVIFFYKPDGMNGCFLISHEDISGKLTIQYIGENHEKYFASYPSTGVSCQTKINSN